MPQERSVVRPRHRIGPLSSGQACGFDYSGHAGMPRAEEGHRAILVNSNPATIARCDPGIADATYVEPDHPGGRGADHREGAPRRAAAHAGQDRRHSNTAVAVRNGCSRTFQRGADRRLHRRDRAPVRTARFRIVRAFRRRGRTFLYRPHDGGCHRRARLPPRRSPSFTMAGGLGSGCHTPGLQAHRRPKAWPPRSRPGPPRVDPRLWKNTSSNSMRDKADNASSSCVRSGTSTVGVRLRRLDHGRSGADLTDREMQRLATSASPSSAPVGVDTGGLQHSVRNPPRDGRIIVIEMNPRVSRSSTSLTSKATRGFRS